MHAAHEFVLIEPQLDPAARNTFAMRCAASASHDA